MQGVLLESASLERYLSLGKSGYPVFQSAQQILATLAQHPELLPFFAVPQPNEKGSQIDWYSPVAGQVIAWNNASDEEKAQARVQLQAFTAQLQAKGQEYLEYGRKGRPDALLFGELLQEACKIPSASNIYLVSPHAGRRSTLGSAPAATAVQWAEAGQGASSAEAAPPALQPVLTFWGFVGNEEDRHKAPLYFLTPPPAKPVPVPAAAAGVLPPAVAPAAPVSPQPMPPVSPVTPMVTPVVVQPWWKRWWLWLALLLLALLALLLLRSCMPRMGIPGIQLPGLGMPNASLPDGSLPNLGMPNVELPSSNLPSANLPDLGLSPGTLPSLPGNAEAPALPEGAGLPALDPSALPAVPTSAMEPPALPQDQRVQPPELPNAQTKVPLQAMPEPPQLEIPKQAADGVAQFLNGKYNTRGGLVDDKTNEPLRLQYDFANGKGQVEIQRSNGVTCKGDVLAAMQKGMLGITNQGGASCDDGSRYEMPKIQCKPGATSVADCTGEYGQRQFPIQMQRKST